MPLHPQSQAFIDSLAEQTPPSWQELGVKEAREVFDSFEPMYGDAPAVERVEDHVTPDGIRTRLYVNQADSNETESPPVMMFFHGGGWVLGSIETHDALCRRMAVHSGCAVVSVDYRRSPENAFPGPVDDCYAATEFVATRAGDLGLDASRLAVAGDSAGGHLATCVAIKSRDQSGPPISVQVLLYPVIQPDFETDSYNAFAEGYGLTRASMQWFWQNFLGHQHPSPASVPSQMAMLAGLPAAIVLTAEYDVLRDEGASYANQLKQAGVDVRHRQADGMLHGFLHFAGLFDPGIEIGKEIAEEIGNRLAAR